MNLCWKKLNSLFPKGFCIIRKHWLPNLEKNKAIALFSYLSIEYKNKKGWIRKIHPFESCFVRIKGLEPPRPKASDPMSDVATNYTISANIRTGTAKAGSKTGFRRCVKRVLSFAKLPEDGRNRAGLSAKIAGSVPVLCKDKESKRQAKQIRACPSRFLSVGRDN